MNKIELHTLSVGKNFYKKEQTVPLMLLLFFPMHWWERFKKTFPPTVCWWKRFKKEQKIPKKEPKKNQDFLFTLTQHLLVSTI